MTGRTATTRHFRERWRMTVEARALVLISACMLAFGFATLYSASAIVAMQEYMGSAYFLQRQLQGAALGIVVFAIAAKWDAERWSRVAWPLMILTMFLMLLTVLPFTEGIAPRIHGSRRFLVGGSLQPSELAKLSVIVWTSMLVVKKGDGGLRRLSRGLMPFIVVVGSLGILALLEPDLSATMMFFLVMSVILFSAGARIGHFVFLAVAGIPLLWGQMQRLQYTLLRMASFLDPGFTQENLNYQLKQSLIAVGSGGAFGLGFGQGRQQYGFLPFAYNDFIGSNIGEEWGFVGLATLVVAWAAWGWLGFRISKQARTPFQKYVGVGLTFTMLVTAYLHIGVVIGLLPTTGLTLPFVSFGRSNLILSMLMTGILANIGSIRERVYHDGATDPLERVAA